MLAVNLIRNPIDKTTNAYIRVDDIKFDPGICMGTDI